VIIEEAEDTDLTREQDDVIYNLKISFPDAALGCEVEVPTLTGKAKIKVPPGTQSGKILKLRGKGFPNINGRGIGDQKIIVQVYVPENLSREEKQILEKLRLSANFNPSSQNKSSKGKGIFGF